MRAIIIGCGRVGALLAVQLAAESHDVRVVDRTASVSRVRENRMHGSRWRELER